MLATLITLSIGTAAVAAMSADMRLVASRAEARASALHATLDPVWFGGELSPIVVEASPAPSGRAPRPAARQEQRFRAAPRAATLRVI
jgi:hypothetical protein